MKKMDLQEILIITNGISDHAQETLQRSNLPITIIHPHGLSEIAMKFVNFSKSSQNCASN